MQGLVNVLKIDTPYISLLKTDGSSQTGPHQDENHEGQLRRKDKTQTKRNHVCKQVPYVDI